MSIMVSRLALKLVLQLKKSQEALQEWMETPFMKIK